LEFLIGDLNLATANQVQIALLQHRFVLLAGIIEKSGLNLGAVVIHKFYVQQTALVIFVKPFSVHFSQSYFQTPVIVES
jgi:hypothetical protein